MGALLTNGADVDVKNKDDDTALIIAARKGDTNMVGALLTNGANVDVKDKEGDTPLLIAVKAGNAEIAKKLLEKGAKVDAKNKGDDTALLIAVEAGYADMVEILLENQADINFKNAEGNTALHIAEKQKNRALVKLLKDKGADPEIANKKGMTPRQYTEVLPIGEGARLRQKLWNGTVPTAAFLETFRGNTELLIPEVKEKVEIWDEYMQRRDDAIKLVDSVRTKDEGLLKNILLALETLATPMDTADQVIQFWKTRLSDKVTDPVLKNAIVFVYDEKMKEVEERNRIAEEIVINKLASSEYVPNSNWESLVQWRDVAKQVGINLYGDPLKTVYDDLTFNTEVYVPVLNEFNNMDKAKRATLIVKKQGFPVTFPEAFLSPLATECATHIVNKYGTDEKENPGWVPPEAKSKITEFMDDAPVILRLKDSYEKIKTILDKEGELSLGDIVQIQHLSENMQEFVESRISMDPLNKYASELIEEAKLNFETARGESKKGEPMALEPLIKDALQAGNRFIVDPSPANTDSLLFITTAVREQARVNLVNGDANQKAQAETVLKSSVVSDPVVQTMQLAERVGIPVVAEVAPSVKSAKKTADKKSHEFAVAKGKLEAATDKLKDAEAAVIREAGIDDTLELARSVLERKIEWGEDAEIERILEYQKYIDSATPWDAIDKGYVDDPGRLSEEELQKDIRIKLQQKINEVASKMTPSQRTTWRIAAEAKRLKTVLDTLDKAANDVRSTSVDVEYAENEFFQSNLEERRILVESAKKHVETCEAAVEEAEGRAENGREGIKAYLQTGGPFEAGKASEILNSVFSTYNNRDVAPAEFLDKVQKEYKGPASFEFIKMCVEQEILEHNERDAKAQLASAREEKENQENKPPRDEPDAEKPNEEATQMRAPPSRISGGYFDDPSRILHLTAAGSVFSLIIAAVDSSRKKQKKAKEQAERERKEERKAKLKAAADPTPGGPTPGGPTPGFASPPPAVAMRVDPLTFPEGMRRLLAACPSYGESYVKSVVYAVVR